MSKECINFAPQENNKQENGNDCKCIRAIGILDLS